MAKTPVEMVEVFVHKIPGDKDYLLVGLNGKLYQVPCGITVKVPKPVKAIIDQRMRNMGVSERFVKKQAKLANKIQGVPE